MTKIILATIITLGVSMWLSYITISFPPSKKVEKIANHIFNISVIGIIIIFFIGLLVWALD